MSASSSKSTKGVRTSVETRGKSARRAWLLWGQFAGSQRASFVGDSHPADGIALRDFV